MKPPSSPETLLASLEAGHPALAALSPQALAAAWTQTVDAFLTPADDDAERLRDQLALNAQLSRAGLDAALDVVLRGVRSPAAVEIFRHTRELGAGGRPALAILASNLPGLAVQALLPALALRRPLLIKSPSAEPLFAPAFLAALSRHLPAVGDAYAALSWRGGDRRIEDPVLAAVDRVVAYGAGGTIEDLKRRAGDKLRGHGPKISVAVIGRGALETRLVEVANGLARDISLFDQRGCLSVQAVITDGDADRLADALSDSLAHYAEVWPMGRDDGAMSAARQARDEAIMRGGRITDLPLGSGTLCVERDRKIRLSPGRRFVRLYQVDSLEQALELLAPWRGLLQGVANAAAESLMDPLLALGVTRLAEPGALQDVDVATWRNGGLAPLEAYL